MITHIRNFDTDEMLKGLEEIKKYTYKKDDLKPQEFSETFFKHITEKFLNTAVEIGEVKEESFIENYGLPTIPFVSTKKDISSILLKILCSKVEKKEIINCYNGIVSYYCYCNKNKCIALEKEFFKLTCSVLKDKIRKGR